MPVSISSHDQGTEQESAVSSRQSLRRSDPSEGAGRSGGDTSGSARDLAGRTEQDLEHLIAAYASDLLTVHDSEGAFLYASGQTISLLGVEPMALRGRRLQDFVKTDDVAAVDRELHDVAGHEIRCFRYRLEAGAGTSRWVETRLRKSSELLVAVTRDIDHEVSRQSAEWTRLKLEARTDWLTQLKNRWGLEEALEVELDRYFRSGRVFSIVLFDVDGFKQVNDQRGHAFGDHVLRRIARMIECSRRSYDVAGRWGGDEFLLILPEATIEEAEVVAARLTDAVGKEWPDLGESGRVTLSGGVVDSRDCEAVGRMIDRADRAMYRAKTLGGNRVCVTTEG